MHSKIRNEMILGAMTGQPISGLRDLYLQGLATIQGLRNQSSIRSAMHHAPKRAQVVRIKLRYGASAEIVLYEPNKNSALPILRIVLRTGKKLVTQDQAMAAFLLADRARGDLATAVRIAAGIERTRMQLHRYFEESTRWL